MNIILEDLKAKYELLSYNIKQNVDELNTLTVNIFTLNPRIAELTKELKNLIDEKDKIKKEIDKMESNNGKYNK